MATLQYQFLWIFPLSHWSIYAYIVIYVQNPDIGLHSTVLYCATFTIHTALTALVKHTIILCEFHLSQFYTLPQYSEVHNMYLDNRSYPESRPIPSVSNFSSFERLNVFSVCLVFQKLRNCNFTIPEVAFHYFDWLNLPMWPINKFYITNY